MARIYVNFSGLKELGENCRAVSSSVSGIRSGFAEAVRLLDWDVKYQGDIAAAAKSIAGQMDVFSRELKSFEEKIENASDQYGKLDEFQKNASGAAAMTGGSAAIGKIQADTGGNDSTLKKSAGAEGPGYDTEKGKVDAWIGKASAEMKNDDASAEVNAYVGKCEAEAKFDAGLMESKTKKEYKDGEWTEKEEFNLLYAEAKAGAEANVLAADASGTLGDDDLGWEGEAEGTVGKAKGEVKGKVSIGDEGVNAYGSAEAMVSAVSGKVSSGVNVAGLEIKWSAEGYAGAAGVKGKAGFVDGKFVLEGGLAAGLGFSTGIEVGLNDTGRERLRNVIYYINPMHWEW